MDVISVWLPDIKITCFAPWNDKKIRIEPSITTYVQSSMSLRELELNARLFESSRLDREVIKYQWIINTHMKSIIGIIMMIHL